MDEKEQRRATILNKVEKGVITSKQAAGVIELSLCHVKRLLSSYRKEGISALAHRNRGKRLPKHRSRRNDTGKRGR